MGFHGDPFLSPKDASVEAKLKEVWKAWGRLNASARATNLIIATQRQNLNYMELAHGESMFILPGGDEQASVLSLAVTDEEDPVLVQSLSGSGASESDRSALCEKLEAFISAMQTPPAWLPSPPEDERKKQLQKQKASFLESAQALWASVTNGPEGGEDSVANVGLARDTGLLRESSTSHDEGKPRGEMWGIGFERPHKEVSDIDSQSKPSTFYLVGPQTHSAATSTGGLKYDLVTADSFDMGKESKMSLKRALTDLVSALKGGSQPDSLSGTQ